MIQPPVDNLYQVVVPFTDIPLFCATTFTVALLLSPRTTLELVVAFERTFNAVVVFTDFEIAFSDEDDDELDEPVLAEEEPEVLFT